MTIRLTPLTDEERANTVPLNNAARRAQGLPEDPNEPSGDDPGYEDYIFSQIPGVPKP